MSVSSSSLGQEHERADFIDVREMRDLAEEFRELIYEMPFQVPQNIIFLARCVGILSGMLQVSIRNSTSGRISPPTLARS